MNEYLDIVANTPGDNDQIFYWELKMVSAYLSNDIKSANNYFKKASELDKNEAEEFIRLDWVQDIIDKTRSNLEKE